MAGFGPAVVVASIPLLSPHACGPSRGAFCALDLGRAPILPDTDVTAVFSGICKSVCKRKRWSW